MGATTNNTGWIEASAEAPVSRGVRRPAVACEVTLSGSYTAGGEQVDFHIPGSIRALIVSPAITGGWHLAWDGQNPPSVRAWAFGGAEAPDGTDLSHITANLLAFVEV